MKTSKLVLISVLFLALISSGFMPLTAEAASLTLSQSSVNLSVGQSATVYATSSNNLAINIPSVTDTSVVTYTHNSTSIFLYAQKRGTSVMRVCDTDYNCANLTINVDSNTYSDFSLSRNDLSLNTGETSSISISGGSYSSYYISSNSNSDIASATLSDRIVNVTGRNPGNTNISICANNNYTCRSLYVTVGGYNNSGNITLSATDVMLNVGQTYNIDIRGDAYNYFNVSSVNTNIVSASIYNRVLTLTAQAAGNTSVKVCAQNYYYASRPCAYVNVSVNNYNNPLTFSPSSLSLSAGQSYTVYIQGGISPYSISSGYNQDVISTNITGSQVYIYGRNSGTTTVNVCGAYGACGSFPVTVSGNNYNYNTIILPSAITGQLIPGYYYSVQLQASNGTAPYYFSIISGSLPTGLTMNSNGVISGYVVAGSSGTFTVRVQDAQNRYATQAYSLSTGGSGGSVLGANIYSNGTLINDNGTIYLTYKNTRTGFSSLDAFRSLGYKLSNVINASTANLADSRYVIGSANISHPWGSWVIAGNTIYFMHQDGMIPISSYDIFTANGGLSKLIVPFNGYDVGKPLLSVMDYNDARLK